MIIISKNKNPFRPKYIVLWGLVIISSVIYMIIRLIWDPYQPPQHHQNSTFNNLVHNPALINNLQILFVTACIILVAIPAIFAIDTGPNGFILGSLPGIIATQLILPILLYGFNKNLRAFVWRETKEWIGFENEIEPQSEIESQRF